MIMQEGPRAPGEGAANRQRQDRAYFLDLLGDSQDGLGRHEAAIEAYRQAAQAFEAQGARCSYALCLLKIAGSYLSLHEPWHAIGYLEACLPLLRELGLTRHFGLAQGRLTGWILSLLPIAMFFLLSLANRGYTRVLVEDPTGRKLVYAGLGLMALGGLAIRKIVNVKI